MKKTSIWYFIINLIVLVGSVIAVALILHLTFWTAFFLYLSIGFLDVCFSNSVEGFIEVIAESKDSDKNEKK